MESVGFREAAVLRAVLFKRHHAEIPRNMQSRNIPPSYRDYVVNLIPYAGLVR